MIKPTSLFARSLCVVLIAALLWTPARISVVGTTALVQLLQLSIVAAHAQDSFGDAIKSGQELGQGQIDAFEPPKDEDGTISFPGSGQSIDMSALYPDEEGEGSASVDELESLYGDSEIDKSGVEAQKRLKSEGSTTGEAYRVISDTNRTVSRPDLSNDPMFNQTDRTLEQVDLGGAGFGECSIDTSFEKGSFDTHVPDYQQCDRNGLPISGNCHAEQKLKGHELQTSVKVGAYMRDRAVFRVDLKNGTWRNTNGIANVAAEIPTLDYDKVCPSGARHDVQRTSTFDWPNAPLEGSFDSSVDYEVTQMPSCENELVGIFMIDDDGSDNLYKYGAQFQLTYRSVSSLKWDDEQCIDAIATAEEFCQEGDDAGVEVSTSGQQDENGCIQLDGITICEGDPFEELLTQPSPGISKWTRAVTVSGMTPNNCPYWKGQMECWTDTQGEEHCPSIEDYQETDCQEYEQDPACGYVSSECTQGAESASGQCVSQTETWDCGYDASVETIDKNETYSCDGAVRCMGGDCVVHNSQTSDDFARAVGALQAAEAIQMDGSCTEANGSEHGAIEECEIFKGDPYECKKAVAGYVDCCTQPKGVSMADYLNLMFSTHRLLTTSAAGPAGAASGLAGAWETLRAPYQSGWNHVTDSWDAVKNGFSNGWDSLTGSTQATASKAGQMGLVTKAKQAMMRKTVEWTAKIFGNGAANSLFVSSAGSGATSKAVDSAGNVAQGSLQLGGTIGSALSGIMLAYTIYSVTKLLIQVIWACEKSEFELGAKRKLKSCHYVGSYCKTKTLGACIEKRQTYCCFASPLSRIIQEQVRPQLGMGWGDKETPACDPLTTTQIQKIDWSKVNLDEWIGILAANGRLPDTDNLTSHMLTGQGSDLAPTGREDVITRAQERIDGIDLDQANRDAGGDLSSRTDIPTDPDANYETDNGGVSQDWDKDGVLNAQDNCTFTKNPDQRDADRDGTGDDCDDD